MHVAKSKRWFVDGLAAIWLSFPLFSSAFAQRGTSVPLPNNDTPPRTALDGFPGFFDSNLADSGSVVADFPTFNIDYGVHEKLTIGVNSLGALFLLTTFNPAIAGKVRYRLFSTDSMRNTLTFYGTYVAVKGMDDKPAAKAMAMLFTNNFTYYFTARSQIYVSTLIGRMDYTEAQESDIRYSKIGLNPILVSFGYQHFFTDNIGLSPLLIYNMYSNLETDSAQSAVSSSTSALTSDLTARVAFDVKFGDSFLLSAYHILTFSEDGIISLPWASLMYRW